MNDTLVLARWLGVYGFFDEGCTWARLLNTQRDQQGEESPTSVVPVWLSPEHENIQESL